MKEEKTNKTIFVLIIILVIIIVGLLIFSIVTSNNTRNTLNVIEPQNETTTNEFINSNLSTDLDELFEKPEMERVQYYIDKYLFYLEAQDYSTAYSLLNSEFKKLYFPTIEKFRTYVLNKYPVVNTISYEGYDKLGKYHIFTIKFSDILNATDTTTPSFEQKFIVVENDLNNFELSFQAE